MFNIEKIKFMLTEHGGFTVDHNGNTADAGFAVGTLSQPTGKKIDQLTVNDLPQIDNIIGHPRFLGGWIDDRGDVWIEPTYVFIGTQAGKYWAIEKAIELNQVAIFDLRKKETIYLGE